MLWPWKRESNIQRLRFPTPKSQSHSDRLSFCYENVKYFSFFIIEIYLINQPAAPNDLFQHNETSFQLQQLSLATSVHKTDDWTLQPRQPGSNLVFKKALKPNGQSRLQIFPLRLFSGLLKQFLTEQPLFGDYSQEVLITNLRVGVDG